jgi:ribonuclease R
MLPEKLSNKLCSLVPEKERLTFSVLMEVSKNGRVLDFLITPGVIRSDYRFNYKEAQNILDQEEGRFYDKLKDMHELANTLHDRRKKYGSVDFDIPEPIFELDEKGMPHEIRPSERLDTHNLIEEFMLLANRCIARRIAVHRKSEKLPFIYRVHESPSREKLIGLYDILNKLGIKLKMPKNFTSRDMAEILDKIEESPFRQFIEQVSLRSMEKAIYTEKTKGHFGLGFDHYSHFTSPIRRYPDLMVHRLLKHYLNGCTKEKLDHFREIVPKVAKKSTDREINAMEAEREFVKLKQIRFISDKIGNEYQGVITGVIEAGIFVEIPDYLIEGMVPVRKMYDDYYVYDEENHQLKGEKTNKTYRLGDIVKIRVERVSLSDREIDFALVK